MIKRIQNIYYPYYINYPKDNKFYVPRLNNENNKVAKATILPQGARNYTCVDPNKVEYFVNQREAALPYLADIIAHSNNEVQLTAGGQLKPCIDVLLVHHQYESGNPCFYYDDFKDLGCKHIFLGHDHKPMDAGRIIYPEFTVYRSGSVMRNRADDYNFTRKSIYYFIIDTEPADGKTIYCKTVTMSNPYNIFKVEAVNKLNTQEKKYTEVIDSLIEKYKNNISLQDKFSIKKIMIELKAKPESINYIDNQYKKIGEIFN